jgi:AraC family transcriptional activator of mtrCDE
MASTKGPEMVADRPKLRIPSTDIDRLMLGLEVHMHALAQCVISPGWRLSFSASDKTAIHYNLRGTGKMLVADFPAFTLTPHTMVIVPMKLPVRMEVSEPNQSNTKSIDVKQLETIPGRITRVVAGNGASELVVVCGYFRTSYSRSIDIFDTLASPIVEKFSESDRLDQSLSAALMESSAQRVGMAAMTASLLKQVVLTLLRRSLETPRLWAERFPVLSDPRVARAFASMIADPGSHHTAQSLARAAGLSRSAFMAHFTRAFGIPPLAALRELRMRHAARLLDANILQIEQIAKAVGYDNRSSFSRAFRAIYDLDPSEYRAAERTRDRDFSPAVTGNEDTKS